MLLKLFRRAAALLAVPALASCASVPQTAASPSGARPALWQVSDPDTKIYLFGTIHLLPKDFRWETPAITQAIASSDTLVVETIIDMKNPAELASELVRLGYAQGLPPLAERVDPAKRPMLEAAIVKSGIPRPLFDRMKTWAAAFTLLGTQFKELGLQGEAGVETTLRNAFLTAGKPIGQLETNGEQLAFFNDLPEVAQRGLLEGAIETPQTASEEFSEMLRAWSTRRRRIAWQGVQPAARRLARAARGAEQAPQRQLEPLDRAPPRRAGHGAGGGRRRAPRRPRFGADHAQTQRLPRQTRPVTPDLVSATHGIVSPVPVVLSALHDILSVSLDIVANH